MRILVLSASRLLRLLLEDVLSPFTRTHNLTVEAATLSEVRAAHDDPVVLLSFERWDPPAAQLVGELSAAASVYVILAGPLPPASYLTILGAGATDAAVEDPVALHALALKLHRWQREVRGPRWQIGDLLVDAVEQRIGWRGRWEGLSPAEVRLLWALFQAAVAGRGLRAQQLAVRLGITEGSVRNVVQRVRRAIEEQLGHPAVLRHDAVRGYFLMLEEPTSPASSTR